jgi:hypothetical protein
MIVLPILVGSVELNIIMSSLFFVIILLDTKNKYPIRLINIISLLIVILLISIIASLFYPSQIYDVVKDFFYLLKPVLFIIIGYYLVRKIKNKAFIFKLIIYSAVFFAFLHLSKVLVFVFENPFNINRLRNFAGKSNYIEMLAIILLFLNIGRTDIPLTRYTRFFKIIIVCSFILYFSRTMFVGVLILYLSVNGYLKISRKGLIYTTGIITAVLLFYMYLFSIEIDRNKSGISTIFYKIKIAPSEIFSTEIDRNDAEGLWDHWRGYEALKAIEQLTDTPYYSGLFFGKGLGSLVDLGFVAPLNEEGMQYVSSLHNGYAFIMYKSGFAGIVFFLVFIIYLYLQAYKKMRNNHVYLINNFISGLAIYYAFTTLIINGIYNQMDIVTVFLGGLIFFQKHYSSNTI